MKITYLSQAVWYIQDFLSDKECQDLIIFSEQQGYQEATVSLESGAKMMKGIRNNYRLQYEDKTLASKYWEKLKDFCPTQLEDYQAVGLNEQFRFYKYESAQRFKKHIDGRFKKSEQEESRITFMVYLNEDFEGGETKFEDLIIKPQQGMALCFIHEQKHEGCAVSQGTKYVIRTDVMYQKISTVFSF